MATSGARTLFALERPAQTVLRTACGKTPGMIVFSGDVPRPCAITHAFHGSRSQGRRPAVIGFDLAGVAVSSGSACSSGKVTSRRTCLQSDGIWP